MSFTPPERTILLAVRGVGPGVVKRLEQLGITTLATLARQDAGTICADVAAMLGSTCWRNQPKAKQAVADAIAKAKEGEGSAVAARSRATGPAGAGGPRPQNLRSWGLARRAKARSGPGGSGRSPVFCSAMLRQEQQDAPRQRRPLRRGQIELMPAIDQMHADLR